MNRQQTFLLILFSVSLLLLFVSTATSQLDLLPVASTDVTPTPTVTPTPVEPSGNTQLDVDESPVTSDEDLSIRVQKLTRTVNILLAETQELRAENEALRTDIQLLKIALEGNAEPNAFGAIDLVAMLGLALSAIGLVLNFSRELRARKQEQLDLAQKVLDLEKAAFELQKRSAT